MDKITSDQLYAYRKLYNERLLQLAAEIAAIEKDYLKKIEFIKNELVEIREVLDILDCMEE